MAAEVAGMAAGRAAFILMAVVVHTVVMAVLRVHCVRRVLGLADQHRKRGGDTLQRHHDKRQQQREFLAPGFHVGRKCNRKRRERRNPGVA